MKRKTFNVPKPHRKPKSKHKTVPSASLREQQADPVIVKAKECLFDLTSYNTAPLPRLSKHQLGFQLSQWTQRDQQTTTFHASPSPPESLKAKPVCDYLQRNKRMSVYHQRNSTLPGWSQNKAKFRAISPQQIFITGKVQSHASVRQYLRFSIHKAQPLPKQKVLIRQRQISEGSSLVVLPRSNLQHLLAIKRSKQKLQKSSMIERVHCVHRNKKTRFDQIICAYKRRIFVRNLQPQNIPIKH